MVDRTRLLLDDLITDIEKLREDYDSIVKVGHTQHVHRDDASERQSGGSHSDPTGAAVIDMSACRGHIKDFERELRRALYRFMTDLGPAYKSLRRAFRSADTRHDERADSRIHA